MSKIRIGIVGYGNIGRGVEAAVGQNPDMELAAIFTRRPPESLTTASQDLSRLGSGIILATEDALRRGPAQRHRLHLLGQGRKQGKNGKQSQPVHQGKA